eukprot:TRINITY_DN1186_c0_g2_i3.p1 TRINITY_DN1186_c0_g2~~TRINITY_DN1186_c0_g2_i3.p1  ORF type:complete len:203 (+),score=54.81 TRINITY_DN1186_c0_g2_i3:71-610(+)
MTSIMIAQATLDSEKEKQKARKRRYYHDDESADTLMYSGSIESVEFPKIKVPKSPSREDDEESSEEVEEKEEKEEKEDKEEKSEEEKSDDEEMPDAEEAPKSFKGMTIAITGKLSLTRAKIEKIITKNGGKFAKSLTKGVTHLIVADPDNLTAKLKKAKEDGVKIVGDNFLKHFVDEED